VHSLDVRELGSRVRLEPDQRFMRYGFMPADLFRLDLRPEWNAKQQDENDWQNKLKQARRFG